MVYCCSKGKIPYCVSRKRPLDGACLGRQLDGFAVKEMRKHPKIFERGKPLLPAGSRASSPALLETASSGYSGWFSYEIDYFLYRQRRPRQAPSVKVFRFVGWGCNVRYAHAHGLTPVARLSVTSFAALSPLPPFISLRSLRSLRLNYFLRQGTAACRGFGRTFLRKRLFLVPASSPRTGYIQGRFLASSFGFAHFEQSVTSFATLRGLKPTARNIEPLRGSSGRLFFFSVTAFHFFANVLRVSAAPREILLVLTQPVFVRLTANA